MDINLQIPIIKKTYNKSLRPENPFHFRSKKICKKLLNDPSFITFGCWNKNMCNIKSGYNKVSLVMNKIDELCESTYPKPSFIVVAGDNYYPDIKIDTLKTPSKIKTINEIELKSGFDCLLDIYEKHKIPIDLVAGNHDLVNTEKGYTINTIDGLTTTDKCFITNKELELAHFPINSLSLCNYRLFGKGNHTLIIMIDSNFYNENNVYKLKDCYINLLEKTIINFKNDNFLKQTLRVIRREFSNIDNNLENESIDKQSATNEIIDLLEQFQNRCLQIIYKKINRSKIKNVVLIAHHPLAYFKTKNQKTPPSFKTATDRYIQLCFNIYTQFYDDTQFYYNSGDLHLYQKSKIKLIFNQKEINIKQYIAGTGGNDLDTIVPVSSKTNLTTKLDNDIEIYYNMEETKELNGFLYWIENITYKKLYVKFITI